MAKQTIKQRKAIRSAAAKKGWETREDKRHAKFIADHQRAYKAGYDFAESMHRVNAACDREMWSSDIGCWAWGRDLNICFEEQQLLQPSLWQRIKRWWA